MDSSERDIDPIDPPTFLEELHQFLQLLNKEFPDAKGTGRRNYVTLDANGNLEVVVWAFNSQGKLGSYFANLDGDVDMFQSMDDVIIDLRKYIERNAI